MNRPTKQSGFAHLMLTAVVVLSVGLIGSLGYIYWQNFMQPKTSTKTGSSTSTSTPEATDPHTDWKTYTNTRAGFSFRYPESFTIINSTDHPTWAEQSSPNHLTIGVSKISSGTEGLDLVFAASSSTELANAINNITAPPNTGLPQANITTKRIGSTNFLRVFPGLAEGCFCKTISYTTIVGDYFVSITSHTPGASPSTGKTDIIDDASFNSKFSSDKDSLITELYGNIESILGTFDKQ